jgi:hypothetical protein
MSRQPSIRLGRSPTVNGLLVSVAGLMAVAVGNELVIARPHDQASVATVVPAVADGLPVGGHCTRSRPRLAGIAALVVAGGLSVPLLPTQPWGL